MQQVAQRPVKIALILLLPVIGLCVAGGFIWWYLDAQNVAGKITVPQAADTNRTIPPPPDPIPIDLEMAALGNWTIQSGDWAPINLGIRGSGDSSVQYDRDLPGDLRLSFAMKVVSGMRPRVHFEGPNIYFGNEGYKKTLFVYGAGAKNLQGPRVPYANGQTLQVSMRILSGAFVLQIDNYVIKGNCDDSPQIRVRFQGGDGWSRGTTEYWNFRVEPAR